MLVDLNQMELGVIRLILSNSLVFLLLSRLVRVFAQALLASSGQDKSMRLEAHMVSANSRYIEEQQEQQQVKKNKGGRMERSVLCSLYYSEGLVYFYYPQGVVLFAVR